MTATHVSTRAWLVRADNPSPMTLDGTNTWVLIEPGGRRAIVVDPGPDDASHRDAVMAAVALGGANEIGLVLLTHGHRDHVDGAPSLAVHAVAPVRAAIAGLCSPGQRPLVDGEQVVVGNLRLEVVSTPGHTADSLCFILDADNALLSGDTLLGQGSTVVARPDGRLAAYLTSLRRLRALVDERQLRVVLPGHGPTVDDPSALIDRYLAHRLDRLAQVQAAARDASNVDDVLAAVYGDVEPALQFAARWSLLAQLDYLREAGERVPPENPTE